MRTRRPTVLDEVALGLDYYRHVLLDTLPDLYREIARAFTHVYGGAPRPARDVPDVERRGPRVSTEDRAIGKRRRPASWCNCS